MQETNSWYRRTLRYLKRRPSGTLGAGVVLVFMVVAIFAPYLAPYHYADQDVEAILAPPSPGHPLGTDELGRDLLSRLIWGSRVSFSVGLIAVGIGISVGLVLGTLGGYVGGLVDRLVVALIDIVWSFPTILLAIGLTAILRPGLRSAMVALGLVTWPQYARVVRGQVLSYKQREFVEAARSMGASNRRIILRHILPQVMSPIIVLATLGMAQAILVEAALSYLGLGVQPPMPSWGSMLERGRNYIYEAPLLTFAPGLSITLVVLGFNLMGDALRDVLDPYTSLR